MHTDEVNTSRVVLARKHHPKDAMLGEIIPIFELTDNILVPLTEHNFCPTMKVFIKSHYEEIDKKFEDDEIFKIQVSVTERDLVNQETGMIKSKYVASGKSAERIKAKDYIQVICHPLPDASNRLVQLDTEFPGTQYIFIEDKGFLFGPFKWSDNKSDSFYKEIKIEFVDTPLPNVKLMPYQIYKVDLDNADVEELITVSSRSNIKIVNDLAILQAKNAVSYEDYSSDEEVMKFCSKVASDFSVKLIDKKQIDTIVATLSRNPKTKADFYKKRLARFSNIGNSINEIKQDVIDEMSLFFNTEAGKNIVGKYISSKEDYYLSKIKKERESEIQDLFSGKLLEIREIEERIKDLTATKSKLSLEVEKKREAANSDEKIQSLYNEKDEKIKEKAKKLEELDLVITEKLSTFKKLKEFENIDEEIAFQERLKERLQYDVRHLQKECKSADIELRNKLNEIRPYVDHITGGFVDVNSPESKRMAVNIYQLPSALDSVVEKQKIVIDYMQKEMAMAGRELEDWQIANLLISTQQSFITFLAGLPGVGKTSLARSLAQVQGLSERCQEISVARGWTGQKDLIGYYNPLASRFQPSNTGLYEFLIALNEESDNENKAMSYVILDEANLSPIEHYWSLFMAMTDQGAKRFVTLGEKDIKIPDYLRFISTINYDGTTEPLSPRVIDRAPIIVLEPKELQFDEISIEKINESIVKLPIGSSQMDLLFGNNEDIPNLTEDELAIYSKIREILMSPDFSWGRPINISPRKEIAIRQFCFKARAFMREYQDFRALDVAILQHILPLIRGNGVPFSKRIEKLNKELEGSELLLSADYTSKILTLGEYDLHTYDFFCW